MKEKEEIKLAFFLNLGFSIFEIIGGILTNSVSIFSDAIHDFGDSLAILISYLLEKFSLNKPNNKYTYGYKRYSLLGAFFTSGILIVGSLLVIINAIVRIFNPVEVNFSGMLLFSIFGIAINGYAAYKTSKSMNLNEKSVNLHMLEDVLGWIAVLIASLVIKLTGLTVIDPILSLVISLFIGFNAVKNIIETIKVIADATPSNIDTEKLVENIKTLESVIDVHHIHLWSLDGESAIITMHVQVKKNTSKQNYEELKDNIRKMLKEFNINHSTIEIDYDECNCSTCE